MLCSIQGLVSPVLNPAQRIWVSLRRVICKYCSTVRLSRTSVKNLRLPKTASEERNCARSGRRQLRKRAQTCPYLIVSHRSESDPWSDDPVFVSWSTNLDLTLTLGHPRNGRATYRPTRGAEEELHCAPAAGVTEGRHSHFYFVPQPRTKHPTNGPG